MLMINANEILFGAIMCCEAGCTGNANCLVLGMEEEKNVFYELTYTSDYVWLMPNGTANVVYYLGSVVDPKVPVFSSSAAETKLLATSFDCSNVEHVKLPEGITEIE